MRYMQIKDAQKLHLVYEAGEGENEHSLVRAGQLSGPICGKGIPNGHFKMTINMPLGHACRNCLKVYAARQKQGKQGVE